MKKKKIIYIILGFVVFVNLPLWDFWLKDEYSYQNTDRSFIYVEYWNANYIVAERNYTYFLCKHPEKDAGDNNLYRTFTLKPWEFWQWREMIFHSDRFRLNYKAP